MKFNEKLIELRKKQGLSQEELGYKLNVTRQTISKWELGQTTPEMDKLIEISKIFNISVDYLISESDVQNNTKTINEEQSIQRECGREKIIKIILISVLIIVLGLIVVKFSTIITNKWNEIKEDKKIEAQKKQEQKEKEEQFYDTIFNTFDNINNSTENYNELTNNNRMFNATIEMYNGTMKGAHVKSLLDNIITSNKTQEKKITVKYGETETLDETVIKNMKHNFETFKDYEITFDYDEKGFINKAIIENL